MESEMTASHIKTHGAGLLLLAVAWANGYELAGLGFDRTGHEPAIVYLLALITFASGSTGVALMVMGPRLFRRVPVSSRWAPHVPATFRCAETAPSSLRAQP